MLESLKKLSSYAGMHTGTTKYELQDMADEIQDEIDSSYMKLPVDADGVPIKTGDSVEWIRKNGIYEVAAVGELVALRTHDSDCFTIGPKSLRHVKPRTVHDVLQDFREACRRAEKEHGEHTQMYDMAMAKAFKDAKDELRMKGGAE